MAKNAYLDLFENKNVQKLLYLWV